MPQPKSDSKPIVCVTRAIPGTVEVPGAEVRIAGPDRLPEQELLEFVSGASAVITMHHDPVNEAFLHAAGPQLRGICNCAVGHNNIDLTACAARGVRVTNTPDAVTEGTADLAWLLVMAVARRLVEADRFARSDAYRTGEPLGLGEMMGMDLTGRTLHIVGAGRIGYATATRALGWGMRVLYTARSRHWEFELAPVAAQRVGLHEGLRVADVISVHTPLTDETRHLIGEAELALLKPTAIVVNTSRGPVIDEAALAKALQERRLWGAGLDVYEHEPAIHEGLLGLDNAVLTPHIGSAAIRYREMMTDMVCANAAAILAGEEPPNAIA